ncbi:hypothetical protein LTR60_002594 [Cryomyces antarcticus]|nr:hypothetical protein LTR60_002594 [Cryomyces antarcticus]
MSLILTVPQEYGYVVLSAAATFWVANWQGVRTTHFRQDAGVPYPHPYASASQMASATPDQKQKMYLFNCSQRAHANFLENQPSLLAALLIAGLRYPVAASALGLGWTLSRILYAVGYTRPSSTEGKGRLWGGAFWLCQWALFGLATFVGYKMVV